MAGFGRTMLTYARPYRAQALHVFLTQLEHLPEPERAALAGRFITERYPEGAVVFEEADLGDRLHILVRGKVEVSTRGPDGNPRPVAVLEDGDFVGEIALLQDVHRTATIRTRTPCVMLALERQQFVDLLNAVPQLRTVFTRAADARQRELAALR